MHLLTNRNNNMLPLEQSIADEIARRDGEQASIAELEEQNRMLRLIIQGKDLHIEELRESFNQLN